jgi:hypothetical protein
MARGLRSGLLLLLLLRQFARLGWRFEAEDSVAMGFLLLCVSLYGTNEVKREMKLELGDEA